MARVDVNQPDSARIGPSLSRVGTGREKKKKKKHMAGRGLSRHQCVGNDVPRTSLRCAVSDAGAAPLALRPCFLGEHRVNYSFAFY